jgi:H+-translocating NAD(P) transhydrogenase subunit alpha
MKVGIVRERREFERRVAASPDSVKRMASMGLDVVVESGAGEGACFTDAAFTSAGASIVPDAGTALADADIVLKVQRPLIGEANSDDELRYLKHGAVLIGLLQPLSHPAEIEAYAKAGIAAFAIELLPRITRAQGMDALSSQANLAGYKAAIEAADEFGRALPMMMTAAGTIKAARVLVMGAGVAPSSRPPTSVQPQRSRSRAWVPALSPSTRRRPAGPKRLKATPARWMKISSAVNVKPSPRS